MKVYIAPDLSRVVGMASLWRRPRPNDGFQIVLARWQTHGAAQIRRGMHVLRCIVLGAPRFSPHRVLGHEIAQGVPNR